MRNPNRIAGFLQCLMNVENQVLTNDVAISVAKQLIFHKLYWTQYEKRVPELKEIYDDEESSFSDEQLNEIIENSPQQHKEAEFDYGWPSRFDTWYKLSMEFE